MSRSALITLDWADGTYSFRLTIAAAEMLQESVDAGPHAVLDRLAAKLWRARDARETIRCGLIGAGMEPPRAKRLVELYCDERPFGDSVQLAMAILLAAIVGAPDEPLAKKKRAARRPRSSA
jgi:hypothetical protein